MNTTSEAATEPYQKSPVAQILVVDDETTIFDVFALMFPKPKHALAVAADSNQALQLAATQGFDLAFVDYFLGNENGAEVAQKLHRVQPNLKIVLMSGYLSEERAAAMEQAGARAFLTKPFSVETAQALERRLVGRKESGDPDARASEA